ncbi:vacuolar-sorting protein SNF8 [Centruroides vittatus]|uniref:vacuolar-sorting protein SNF8 n=1 Tax=Centruroides vittatus TaxID=120091 RepID=UPI00350F2FB8
MKRRGVGAIQKQQLTQTRFRDKGYELAAEQLEQMSKQMEAFRENLQQFADKYKSDIRKDPHFRRQFQDMCASVGVDPLASSKGFWADMLGVGDFYYQLGVQIIEVCLATRYRNGGIVPLDELTTRVVASRGRKQDDVGPDDIQRAVEKLKVLGEGFTFIHTGGRLIIQSIPAELNVDHTAVIQQAEGLGYVSASALAKELKWSEHRVRTALEDLVKEGLAWVDDKGGSEKLYWFPGLVKNLDA